MDKEFLSGIYKKYELGKNGGTVDDFLKATEGDGGEGFLRGIYTKYNIGKNGGTEDEFLLAAKKPSDGSAAPAQPTKPAQQPQPTEPANRQQPTEPNVNEVYSYDEKAVQPQNVLPSQDPEINKEKEVAIDINDDKNYQTLVFDSDSDDIKSAVDFSSGTTIIPEHTQDFVKGLNKIAQDHFTITGYMHHVNRNDKKPYNIDLRLRDDKWLKLFPVAADGKRYASPEFMDWLKTNEYALIIEDDTQAAEAFGGYKNLKPGDMAYSTEAKDANGNPRGPHMSFEYLGKPKTEQTGIVDFTNPAYMSPVSERKPENIQAAIGTDRTSQTYNFDNGKWTGSDGKEVTDQNVLSQLNTQLKDQQESVAATAYLTPDKSNPLVKDKYADDLLTNIVLDKEINELFRIQRSGKITEKEQELYGIRVENPKGEGYFESKLTAKANEQLEKAIEERSAKRQSNPIAIKAYNDLRLNDEYVRIRKYSDQDLKTDFDLRKREAEIEKTLQGNPQSKTVGPFGVSVGTSVAVDETGLKKELASIRDTLTKRKSPPMIVTADQALYEASKGGSQNANKLLAEAGLLMANNAKYMATLIANKVLSQGDEAIVRKNHEDQLKELNKFNGPALQQQIRDKDSQEFNKASAKGKLNMIIGDVGKSIKRTLVGIKDIVLPENKLISTQDQANELQIKATKGQSNIFDESWQGQTIERKVTVGGQDYYTEDGQISYKRDGNGARVPFTATDQKNIDEYDKNRDQYEISKQLNVKHFLVGSYAVARDMLPGIAAGVLAGPLGGAALSEAVMAATTMGQVFGDYQADALQRGEDTGSAYQKALIKSFVNFALERASGFEAGAAKTITGAINKSLKSQRIDDLVTGALKGKVTLPQVLKEVFQDLKGSIPPEIITEMAQSIADNAQNSMMYGDKFKMPSLHELEDVIMTMPLGMFVFGAGSKGAEYASRQSAYKDGLGYAINNPEQFQQTAITIMESNPEQAEKMKANFDIVADNLQRHQASILAINEIGDEVRRKAATSVLSDIMALETDDANGAKVGAKIKENQDTLKDLLNEATTITDDGLVISGAIPQNLVDELLEKSKEAKETVAASGTALEKPVEPAQTTPEASDSIAVAKSEVGAETVPGAVPDPVKQTATEPAEPGVEKEAALENAVPDPAVESVPDVPVDVAATDQAALPAINKSEPITVGKGVYTKTNETWRDANGTVVKDKNKIAQIERAALPEKSASYKNKEYVRLQGVWHDKSNDRQVSNKLIVKNLDEKLQQEETAKSESPEVAGLIAERDFKIGGLKPELKTDFLDPLESGLSKKTGGEIVVVNKKRSTTRPETYKDVHDDLIKRNDSIQALINCL